MILKRQIPTQRWLVVIESCLPSPHCLVAQDVALSRPKRGFEFLWGHKKLNLFSKQGSPEGDSIRIPPGAQKPVLVKTRIPGRGFIRIPLGVRSNITYHSVPPFVILNEVKDLYHRVGRAQIDYSEGG